MVSEGLHDRAVLLSREFGAEERYHIYQRLIPIHQPNEDCDRTKEQLQEQNAQEKVPHCMPKKATPPVAKLLLGLRGIPDQAHEVGVIALWTMRKRTCPLATCSPVIQAVTMHPLGSAFANTWRNEICTTIFQADSALSLFPFCGCNWQVLLGRCRGQRSRGTVQWSTRHLHQMPWFGCAPKTRS